MTRSYALIKSDYIFQYGRKYTSQAGSYRYGFNGQEKVDEIEGEGNSYNFGDRMYDPRLGRWWATDKYEVMYPGVSTYSSALNNPICNIDVEGNFVIEGTDAQKNRLRSFVKAAKKALDSDPYLLELVMRHSGLSELEINAIFTDDYGPVLQFSVMDDEKDVAQMTPCDYCENSEDFLKTLSDNFFNVKKQDERDRRFKISLAFLFDNADFDKEDSYQQFYATIVILHELVHLGDYRDGIKGNNINYDKWYNREEIERMITGSDMYSNETMKQYIWEGWGFRQTNYRIEPGKGFEAALLSWAINNLDEAINALSRYLKEKKYRNDHKEDKHDYTIEPPNSKKGGIYY